MLNTLKSSTEVATAGSDKLRGLVWNEDLSLQSDSNAAVQQRRQAIDRARANRPRTAHIEREIMIAVVVLYILILGSFASLHLYGHYMVSPGAEQVQSED
ncbi:hypothetical protein [Alcaligenes faecalis]|uniref:hypothetical protein n=1 Tax=Alcaligenes faecalis TaxID=511 RepID=UPI00208E47BA|nr:hypothetical protein [Alcaligenes faecalis]USP47501.1 hypothetical protein J5J84_16080 [Alcaligenes faecalis]